VSERAEKRHRDMSRTDMPRLARIASSLVTRVLTSSRTKATIDGAHERWRRLQRAPHRVEYYHEVADPYSHLAAQALQPLAAHYDIVIEPRVAAVEEGTNRPEPALLAALARRDCALVAPHYGLEFPADAVEPDPEAVRRIERRLVAAEGDGFAAFAERAVELGRALWSGDVGARAGEDPGADATRIRARLDAASARRARRGHYSGAMFRYGGEWFWGVDRLHHLERRLTALGAAREDAFLFGRPPLETARVERGDELTLEIFPSLRSPYSAIGYEPALDLAKATGIGRVTRPVLPMVMRGVPVTLAKGLYIFRDTKREAACLGMPFGNAVDPIGEPVRRAFSLWPWAQSKGRGEGLLASFMRAAWAEGVDTSTDAGLRRVVERAGLDWTEARSHLDDLAWEEELETNRRRMIDEMGQWGVPSFRLRGPEGEPDLVVWGQDRLWVLSREIQRRGASD
jgi:2-hydroxychromene-2-carboxylate isomerase